MQPKKQFSKTFEASLSILHEVLQWVVALIKEEKILPAEIKKVEIALEEAIVNIISYAYKDKKGAIELIYSVDTQGWIELTLKDNGPPFNPRVKDRPLEHSTSIEECQIGGLGIPFIHRLMDVVEYRREAEVNVLTLKKKL
ncbi:MAG: ATP-binding protein [Chlamydiota bacterium]